MLRSRFAAAWILCAVQISHAQAHELEGIDHVHLSDGVVQIVEPIPGVTSITEARPTQTEKGIAPKATQFNGVVSLIVQVVLIGSAVILLLVALRAAGMRSRERRRTLAADDPSHPTTPGPPA